MNTPRPLSGCTVGISISESAEMDHLGFDRSEMNRCVVRLSESLLAAGAQLAFGHDWRPGGVMEAVAALAVRYVNVHRDAAGHPAQRPAPILNFVAPPDVPFLTQETEANEPWRPVNPMLRLLEGIVEARQTKSPPGSSRAEALSLMREELSRRCHIRVCLGGKLEGYSGSMPGIIEEAVGALNEQRPVFASGIFGGASRVIVEAFGGKRDGQFASQLEPAMGVFRRSSLIGSRDEERLWGATSIEQCVELILRCSVKWWNRNNPRTHGG